MIIEWHIKSAKTESAKLTFKIEGGTKRFSEKKKTATIIENSLPADRSLQNL